MGERLTGLRHTGCHGATGRRSGQGFGATGWARRCSKEEREENYLQTNIHCALHKTRAR